MTISFATFFRNLLTDKLNSKFKRKLEYEHKPNANPDTIE